MSIAHAVLVSMMYKKVSKIYSCYITYGLFLNAAFLIIESLLFRKLQIN